MFGQECNFGIYIADFIKDTFVNRRRLSEFSDKAISGYPFVSSDESYLIFASRYEKGHGQSDLYIMFRELDSSWTMPINMGPTINTSSSESFPSVSPDGKYLFFNSNRISSVRDTEPSHFYGNIYWVSTEIIDKLKTNK